MVSWKDDALGPDIPSTLKQWVRATKLGMAQHLVTEDHEIYREAGLAIKLA